MTFNISGTRELEKALFDLGSNLSARRIGRKVLTEASRPMVEMARALAPDDPNTPGALKESIKAQSAKNAALNRGEGALRANLDRDEVAGIVIGIDGDLRPHVLKPRKRGVQSKRSRRGKRGGMVEDLGVAGYSVIQEFGSKKMEANPYMRPAFDAEAAATIVRSVGILREELRKAAARIRK